MKGHHYDRRSDKRNNQGSKEQISPGGSTGGYEGKDYISTKTEDTYIQNVFLTLAEGGDRREYILELPIYVYSVAILDNAGNVLTDYPILPGLKSTKSMNREIRLQWYLPEER